MLSIRPAMPASSASRAMRVDNHMAEPVGQRDEVALGIDDDLLHPGALCSSRRRSRCDLPEPELPWTSKRVASNSSRSSMAGALPDAVPISISTSRSPLFESTMPLDGEPSILGTGCAPRLSNPTEIGIQSSPCAAALGTGHQIMPIVASCPLPSMSASRQVEPEGPTEVMMKAVVFEAFGETPSDPQRSGPDALARRRRRQGRGDRALPQRLARLDGT